MLGARKPLRLRSACTECYAAKVRCSGEKYGCGRCRRNGLACEYQVSMVGRAPKKRRTQANDQILYPQEPPSSLDANLQHTGRDLGSSPQFIVDLSSLPGVSAPAVNTLTVDAPGFAMDDLSAIAAQVETNNYLQNLLSDYPSLPLVSCGPTDPFFPGMEQFKLPDPHADIMGTAGSEKTVATSGLHPHLSQSSSTSVISDNYTSASLTGERTSKPVRPKLTEQTTTKVPSSYRDQSVLSRYPHTAALMQMIELLEEKFQAPQVPIDQAMRLNRHAMAKIRDLSKTNEFQQCQSCPLLVATMMDLVVRLYEIVILPIEHPASEVDDASLADQNSTVSQATPAQQSAGTDIVQRIESGPSTTINRSSEALFRFGCLEFDPDEQEIFRAAMIRGDLRRCVETIQFCNQEMMKQRKARMRGPSINQAPPSSIPSNEHVHTQWYQEMACRVKDLLISLPALCNHNP